MMSHPGTIIYLRIIYIMSNWMRKFIQKLLAKFTAAVRGSKSARLREVNLPIPERNEVKVPIQVLIQQNALT